jgi:hypothetical protein
MRAKGEGDVKMWREFPEILSLLTLKVTIALCMTHETSVPKLVFVSLCVEKYRRSDWILHASLCSASLGTRAELAPIRPGSRVVNTGTSPATSTVA